MNAETLIGRAVSALASKPSWDSRDAQKVLLDLCDSKDQAGNLAKQLKALGYIERQVIVTDRARKRAAK